MACLASDRKPDHATWRPGAGDRRCGRPPASGDTGAVANQRLFFTRDPHQNEQLAADDHEWVGVCPRVRARLPSRDRTSATRHGGPHLRTLRARATRFDATAAVASIERETGGMPSRVTARRSSSSIAFWTAHRWRRSALQRERRQSSPAPTAMTSFSPERSERRPASPRSCCSSISKECRKPTSDGGGRILRFCNGWVPFTRRCSPSSPAHPTWPHTRALSPGVRYCTPWPASVHASSFSWDTTPTSPPLRLRCTWTWRRRATRSTTFPPAARCCSSECVIGGPEPNTCGSPIGPNLRMLNGASHQPFRWYR